MRIPGVQLTHGWTQRPRAGGSAKTEQAVDTLPAGFRPADLPKPHTQPVSTWLRCSRFFAHLALPLCPQTPHSLLPTSRSSSASSGLGREHSIPKGNQAAWLGERLTKDSIVADMGHRAPQPPSPPWAPARLYLATKAQLCTGIF